MLYFLNVCVLLVREPMTKWSISLVLYETQILVSTVIVMFALHGSTYFFFSFLEDIYFPTLPFLTCSDYNTTVILGCASKNFQTDWLLSCFILLRARLSELQAVNMSLSLKFLTSQPINWRYKLLNLLFFESLVSILGRYLRWTDHLMCWDPVCCI